MARENILLTADIGSSRIIASLIKKKGEGKAQILCTALEDIPFQANLDPDRFASLVAASLDKCLQELSAKSAGCLPTQALCTLSSLLYEAKLSVNKKSFPAETQITADIMRSVKKEGEDNLAKDKIDLENAIIQIRLNGYIVTKPVGRYAKEIDTAQYWSVADKNLIKQIKEIFSKHFHSVPVDIHSFSFAAFTVLRNMIHDENFIFLDFGGEITDIVISKRGILEKTISIPFGKNFIIREIMKNMNVSYAIAESSLRLHHEGTLSHEFTETVKLTLEGCRHHWKTLFLGTLEHITLDSLLPQDIHVLANPSVMPIIISYMSGENYEKFVFVGQPFRVHEINDKTLTSFYDQKNKSTFIDPFIVISSLFSDTLAVNIK